MASIGSHLKAINRTFPNLSKLLVSHTQKNATYSQMTKCGYVEKRNIELLLEYNFSSPEKCNVTDYFNIEWLIRNIILLGYIEKNFRTN